MPTTPEALIAELERLLADDAATVQALQTALEDCDPREQFAIDPDLLPDLPPPPPVRRAPAPVLPMGFIRA